MESIYSSYSVPASVDECQAVAIELGWQLVLPEQNQIGIRLFRPGSMDADFVFFSHSWTKEETVRAAIRFLLHNQSLLCTEPGLVTTTQTIAVEFVKPVLQEV